MIFQVEIVNTESSPTATKSAKKKKFKKRNKINGTPRTEEPKCSPSQNDSNNEDEVIKQ